MVHGMPDEAHVKSYTDITRTDDISELAARLGSPQTYERRGNVLYVDDFSHGANTWTVTRGLGTENATLSGTYNLVGGAALLLQNTQGVGETVYAVRYLPLFSDAIYGLFFMLSINTAGNKIQCQALHFGDTTRWNYVITLYPNEKTLYYTPSGGTPSLLTDNLDIFNGSEIFHLVGIIFDTIKHEWVQVIIDNVVYDVSGIEPTSIPNSIPPHFRFGIVSISTSELDTTTIVDSIVLTQNPTLVN